MSQTFNVIANARTDTGKGSSRRLRRTGMVPGIIYGSEKDPEMFSTKENVLMQLLDNEAFYSQIITVELEGGKAQKVVLKDLQRHPARNTATHLDLLRVGDNDRIKMTVPLHFVGQDVAPGAKAGGNFQHVINDIEISCLAKSLPEFISVDVSAMELDEIVHLSDLKLDEGTQVVALTFGEDHDSAVVTLTLPRGGSDDEDGAPEAPDAPVASAVTGDDA